MVDYSVVRSNCPLISFFFAHLSSLLEVVGRQCSKAGLFMGIDCSFKFVLHFLFSFGSLFCVVCSTFDNVWRG